MRYTVQFDLIASDGSVLGSDKLTINSDPRYFDESVARVDANAVAQERNRKAVSAKVRKITQG